MQVQKNVKEQKDYAGAENCEGSDICGSCRTRCKSKIKHN